MVEYRNINFVGGASEFDEQTVDALNELGKDGWTPVIIKPQLPYDSSDTKWSWIGLFYRAETPLSVRPAEFFQGRRDYDI